MASSVIVQLLGCRQEVELPSASQTPLALQKALTHSVAQQFEVSPPFSFSSSQGAPLEDAESLAEAVKAGSMIVAHLGDGALHDLGRRVRQLRNLQWGLVNQQLENVRVESAVRSIPTGSCSKSAESILGQQFADFRQEVKQTLQQRMANLLASLEQRLQLLEESWEKRLGAAIAAVSSAQSSPKAAKEAADARREEELENLSDLLRAESRRVASSVDDLRQECREAMQREVRARLEHHRNLQEEFRREAQNRIQVTRRLDQDIQELARGISGGNVRDAGGARQRALADEPLGQAKVLLPWPSAAEPPLAASPTSAYPSSLQGDVSGSPSGDTADRGSPPTEGPVVRNAGV
mmetsp:Transcript_53461/g.124514  ORF Transcript_53461/g.124514 Transcript_53461/m.124514 type:complete len:351 (+) Transcript_53461:41-1093(+)